VIVLNGQARKHGAGMAIAELLQALGLPAQGRGVAVAIDGEVVPRAVWETRAIPEGARVEVLTAMQGG
jgi:sulfur carrier protein